MRHAAAFPLFLILTLIHVGTAAEQPRQNQPRQGRFTFQQFSARHDSNRDGKIERDEFKGNPQFFRWLDRDSDGVITADEFQKSTQRDGRKRTGVGRRIPDGVKVLRDLEYANVDGKSLRLDLYLPEKSDDEPPLLVWIHGGGWTKGSKSGINPIFIRLTAEGYAAASIDYRLDGLTSHPKQIHACKGAIRWLRANADKHGYDVTRIGVGGGSAGGFRQTTYTMVFGKNEDQQKDLSPMTHVAKDKNIPPFLILHVADRPDSGRQSKAFAKALEQVGVKAKVIAGEGNTRASINRELGLPDDKPTLALFEFREQAVTK